MSALAAPLQMPPRRSQMAFCCGVSAAVVFMATWDSLSFFSKGRLEVASSVDEQRGGKTSPHAPAADEGLPDDRRIAVGEPQSEAEVGGDVDNVQEQLDVPAQSARVKMSRARSPNSLAVGRRAWDCGSWCAEAGAHGATVAQGGRDGLVGASGESYGTRKVVRRRVYCLHI